MFDLKLPILALIGVRNGLVAESRDSAKTFTKPIVNAWGLKCIEITSPEGKPRLESWFRTCLRAKEPGLVLLAEGAM